MGTRLAIDWQAPGLRSRNRTCARWRAHSTGHHRPNDCISAPPEEPASATATEARKERGRVSKSRSISVASVADSSFRTMARFESALAVSTSIRSGARSSTSSFRNLSRRKSAAALSGSGKNHFKTTLASTTQIKVSGLGPRESEERYRKERPPSAGFRPGVRECVRPDRSSVLRVSPYSCGPLRSYWRRPWILFAC
jgi:hypothetical protein